MFSFIRFNSAVSFKIQMLETFPRKTERPMTAEARVLLLLSPLRVGQNLNSYWQVCSQPQTLQNKKLIKFPLR